MSNVVSHLLTLFDALPEPDKRLVVFEILRRSPPASGDVPEAVLDALAEELLVALDAEESARAENRALLSRK